MQESRMFWEFRGSSQGMTGRKNGMKKALIIGAAGFVGHYLINHLREQYGWSVTATKMKAEELVEDGITVRDLDILEKGEIETLLREEKPDYIFHLAAQSSVALSWKNPQLTVDINIKGTCNLLEAVRNLDHKPRLLLIGSGEEYGYILPEESPVAETNQVRPGNIYAATKACQNMFGNIYAKAYDMDVMMVRAFNHIGPNQLPTFVVADFCSQVAAIEKGEKEPVLYVGNLSAKRDFTDVRDVVQAYGLIMQHGKRGLTYNVGRGASVAIQEILEKILGFAKVPIKVEVDEKKLRPVDIPDITADIHLLQKDTGWQPEIPLEQTLEETLEYWRNR